jgi:hypothetical protein
MALFLISCFAHGGQDYTENEILKMALQVNKYRSLAATHKSALTDQEYLRMLQIDYGHSLSEEFLIAVTKANLHMAKVLSIDVCSALQTGNNSRLLPGFKCE